MLKLLYFISLAAVSVSASLSNGTFYRIINSNGNELKLDMSSSRVVGGSNSESVQLWQLIQPVPPMSSNVYAIMPMTAEPIVNLMTFDTGDSGATPENGDNAIVQPGDMYQAKFQWTIIQVPTDSTGDYYTITRISPDGDFNVDLYNGSKADGAKVQAYRGTPASGNVNQWWKFV
ncbi:hypothetical protein EDD85DRAFT_787930 [Armillaria nabsnona]|nr:hypothetical protein EDD85DRAFT_787930 [Armillaria nabsnona]